MKIPAGILLCLALSAFTGCGDRNADDYRREKMGLELARYQAVAGTYSGPLVTGRGESPGQISIALRAEAANIDSSDRLSSEQKAVLRGEVSFSFNDDSTRKTTLAFNDGYYNDAEGTFRATIQVNQSVQAVSQVTRLDLYGRIASGRFDGRIEVSGFKDDGAGFRAVRDDRSLAPGSASPPSGKPRPALDLRLASRAKFSSDGRIETVRARVSASESSNEEDFLLLLKPVRIVNITMNMEPGLIFITTDGRWDLRAGTLRAKLSTPSGRGQVELSCREVPLADGGKGWDCHADGLFNSLFDGIFVPET